MNMLVLERSILKIKAVPYKSIPNIMLNGEKFEALYLKSEEKFLLLSAVIQYKDLIIR